MLGLREVANSATGEHAGATGWQLKSRSALGQARIRAAEEARVAVLRCLVRLEGQAHRPAHCMPARFLVMHVAIFQAASPRERAG